MNERSTLLILAVLFGALALYILARRNDKLPISPKTSKRLSPRALRPQRHTPQPQRRAPQPRKRSFANAISTTRPTTQASSISLKQRFERLRRRILDPTSGLIYKRKLLPAAMVQKVLGFPKPLQAVFLQGIPRSRRYDAVQFVLRHQPTANQYILGLQVWLGKPQAIQARWASQQRSYPNVRPHAKAVAGLHSFVAHRSDVSYLNVQTRTSVFSLSCHQKYCPKGKHLKTFAHTVATLLP